MVPARASSRLPTVAGDGILITVPTTTFLWASITIFPVVVTTRPYHDATVPLFTQVTTNAAPPCGHPLTYLISAVTSAGPPWVF